MSSPGNIQEKSIAELWDVAVGRFDGGDVAGAVEAFQALADRGDADAMAELGVIYETGGGVISKDFGLAIRYYRESASRGCPEGILAVARLHLLGDNCKRDPTIARKCYELVIEEVEEPRALFGLGWIYDRGLGVERNDSMALLYLHRAWQAGHLIAPKWVGNIYWAKGNYLKAICWWIGGLVKVLRVSIFDRKNVLLHRQL